jgi:hypothetical protein
VYVVALTRLRSNAKPTGGVGPIAGVFHWPWQLTDAGTLRCTIRGMLVRLTRLTNERHRLELVRDDGTREAHELETRSTLLHDLVHYAVETEAGLNASFYGRLASGTAYAALVTEPSPDAEALQTELVVVRVQGIAKSDSWTDVDPASLAESINAGFRSLGNRPPAWLTGDLIVRVRERLRRVQGQWRATPFHQTLVLEFPLRAT